MTDTTHIAIIGAGPAALMAAETLATSGHRVAIYDRMPSPARKLLIAGRGGLNLTHSEPLAQFLTRYGDDAEPLEAAIRAFPPEAVRSWCAGLGIETFVGSSGRVFPKGMKASGLLRAWLRRLTQYGVTYHPRHRWLGWNDTGLVFETPTGPLTVTADATLLALGGASWPRLGSDGSWVDILVRQAIPVLPLQPANCGFITQWSDFFRERFAGHPLKSLAITHGEIRRQGEAMITEHGLEGGLIYSFSRALRTEIQAQGYAPILLDLRPTMTIEALRQKLSVGGSKSLGARLRSVGFSATEVALLHETTLKPGELPDLATRLKAIPLTLLAPTDIARAISSAGGLSWRALDEHYMLRRKPGVFVAGEMIDWDAPTGGYLLQACFSTGVAAAKGIARYLASEGAPEH